MVRNRTRFCEHANQILRNFVLNSARNRTRFCASPVPESAGTTLGCPQSYPQFERRNRGAPVFFCHRRTHFCVRKRNWSRSGLGYRADRTRFCGSGRGAVCTKRTQICVVLTDGPICAPINMGIARKQAHASAIRGKFGPYPILRACCGGCLRDRGGQGSSRIATFIAESARVRRRCDVPRGRRASCRTRFCGKKGLFPKGLAYGHLHPAYPFLRRWGR